MAQVNTICSQCGTRIPDPNAHYCGNCGQAVTRTHQADQAVYSPALIGIMRLMAAACMFSAMYAAWLSNEEPVSQRPLIMAGVSVALLGMFFVFQASKKVPPVWAPAILAVFWVGVAGLVVLWWVKLSG